MTQREDTPGFEHVLAIAAPPARVVRAFFDPIALAFWWQARRSVTAPRPLGVYAIEWDRSESRDDVLGPLGGIFHGKVIDHDAATGFFVADAYWLPPFGDPIGPMALHVSCAAEPPVTLLHVLQSGYEESLRWTRYYSVIAPGWKASLAALKDYLERESIPPDAA